MEPVREIWPRTWLVLPGWRQSEAHWRPVSRWLNRDRISVVSEDLAAMSADCENERGGLARLMEMRERLTHCATGARASVIIGHSAGAPLAVLTAAALPDVRCLMLIEPVIAHILPSYHGGQGHWYGELASVGAQGKACEYPLATMETIRTIEAQSMTLARHQLESMKLPSINAERTAAVAKAYSTLKIPLFILRGQRSGIVSVDDVETLAAAGSNTNTAEIALAGHSPHIDQPRQTAEAMLNFETVSGFGHSERTQP